MNQDKTVSYRYLPVSDITPKDDNFHGSKYLLDIEWWYFDAVFENGLSAHIGFRIYHIRGIGILQTRINLYENGVLIKEKINRHLLTNITFDTKNPIIIINDKTVLNFFIDKSKKESPWIYNINLKIEDIILKLRFTGLTQGWKIETESTCWTVPLPNANVKGTISYNGKTQPVNGSGYHDHNWGYSPTTVLQNIGWYWGRISSKTLHITWANTITSERIQDLITVVNKSFNSNNQQQSYIHIHPDNINLITSNYKKQNKITIPESFELSFSQPLNGKDTLVSAHLKMNTIDIHYDRIFIINYWRYHVEVSGSIQYGKIKEIINRKPQIIEYLRF